MSDENTNDTTIFRTPSERDTESQVKWAAQFGPVDVQVQGDLSDSRVRDLIDHAGGLLHAARDVAKSEARFKAIVGDALETHGPDLVSSLIERIRGTGSGPPGATIVAQVQEEFAHMAKAGAFMRMTVSQGWTWTIGLAQEEEGEGIVMAEHPQHGSLQDKDECFACAVERMAEEMAMFLREEQDNGHTH